MAYLPRVRVPLIVLLVPLLAQASGGSVEGTITVKKDGAPGTVKNALVFISGYATAPPAEVRMSQSGRAFQPVVLPVVQGGKVRFSNDELDAIYHHVFSPSKKVMINTDKFKPKASWLSEKMTTEGAFEVFCDIHREMISTVYVVPNDRFTVLDSAEGSSAPFKIEGIKPGKWMIVGWHRSAKGRVEQSVEIKAGQTTHLDLEINGESGVEKLLEHHKRRVKDRYDEVKADGGAVGEAVGLEDKWK